MLDFRQAATIWASVQRTMLTMKFGFRSSSSAPAAKTTSDSDFAEAVKRSDTGQLSVSIDDLSKTQTFKNNLDVLKRIRERSEGLISAR